MPSDTHQGFAFTVNWNLLPALSLLFFRGSPMLRQLGGKVSCCFCLDRKISGSLFERNFPKQRCECWGFLLMNWHLLWTASSPWGAHFLVCGRKSTCSWWKAGKVYLRAFEKCLISSWWLSRASFRKPGAAPCQELMVSLLACPFHLGPRHFPLVLTHSRLPQCPQVPSLSITVFVYQTGSSSFSKYSMFQVSGWVFNNSCPSCPSSSPACHTALVLCDLLQPRSFVAALILTDTVPNQ